MICPARRRIALASCERVHVRLHAFFVLVGPVGAGVLFSLALRLRDERRPSFVGGFSGAYL